jgi:hypothetical protein
VTLEALAEPRAVERHVGFGGSHACVTACSPKLIAGRARGGRAAAYGRRTADERGLRPVPRALPSLQRARDAVLAHMTDDVDWPNAWEGGRVAGKEAVREYWTRQ